MVDKRKAYLASQLEYDANDNGIADWDEVLTGLKSDVRTAYESQATPIAQQASYDISQAYENYKKTQLNLLQNQQLGSGFKEQLASDLSKTYGTTYRDIRREESSDINQLQSAYRTKYKEMYDEKVKELETETAQLDELERLALEYRGITADEAEKLYYTLNDEGEYVLNAEGRDFYAKTFLDPNVVGGELTEEEKKTATEDEQDIRHFADYVYEQNPELYDYYMANKEKAGYLIGGLSKEDYTKLYEQSSGVLAATEALKPKIKTAYDALTDVQKQRIAAETGMTYDQLVSAKYDTHGARKTAYNKYLSAINNVKPSDPAVVQSVHDRNAVEGGHNKYSINNTTYVKGKELDANSEQRNKISQKLRVIRKLDSGEMEYGDVIQYKNEYYVITKQGKQPTFTILIKK